MKTGSIVLLLALVIAVAYGFTMFKPSGRRSDKRNKKTGSISQNPYSDTLRANNVWNDYDFDQSIGKKVPRNQRVHFRVPKAKKRGIPFLRSNKMVIKAPNGELFNARPGQSIDVTDSMQARWGQNHHTFGLRKANNRGRVELEEDPSLIYG